MFCGVWDVWARDVNRKYLTFAEKKSKCIDNNKKWHILYRYHDYGILLFYLFIYLVYFIIFFSLSFKCFAIVVVSKQIT